MAELQARRSRASYHRANGGANPALVMQKVAPVQQFSLFSDLSLADCAQIVSGGHEKQFSRKQIIFLEGDRCEQIWLLISGCAKLTQIGQNGTEVILRVSGSGDVLGALGSSPLSRQCYTVQALESCLVLFWDTRFFEAVSARVPVLRRNVVRILQARLSDMEERFREISTEKAASRLSSELVRLAQHIGHRKIEGIEISISQQELAQLTGTTLFTVSRLLSQWEHLGAVKTRREAVSVCNLQELASISVTE
jgi:CRP/FNR family transcriptional regulator, nitrogen oxide reductase regulator